MRACPDKVWECDDSHSHAHGARYWYSRKNARFEKRTLHLVGELELSATELNAKWRRVPVPHDWMWALEQLRPGDYTIRARRRSKAHIEVALDCEGRVRRVDARGLSTCGIPSQTTSARTTGRWRRERPANRV